jgi:hypothetical protein
VLNYSKTIEELADKATKEEKNKLNTLIEFCIKYQFSTARNDFKEIFAKNGDDTGVFDEDFLDKKLILLLKELNFIHLKYNKELLVPYNFTLKQARSVSLDICMEMWQKSNELLAQG